MTLLAVRWVLVVLGGIGLTTAAAQEPQARPGGASPLGIRQQRVERMMEDLERKFKTLKLALQQTEPERAERLQQTLNKAKELLIQKRMGDISKLLDQTLTEEKNTDEALTELAESAVNEEAEAAA